MCPLRDPSTTLLYGKDTYDLLFQERSDIYNTSYQPRSPCYTIELSDLASLSDRNRIHHPVSLYSSSFTSRPWPPFCFFFHFGLHRERPFRIGPSISGLLYLASYPASFCERSQTVRFISRSLCVTFSLSIHLLTDSGFHSLATINNIAKVKHMQTFCCTLISGSLMMYIPCRKISGSSICPVFNF